MQAVCSVHGLTRFSFNPDRGGHYCVRCYSAKRKRERRQELKLKAVEYKGGKCSKCGYDQNIHALDFHHLDPKAKELNISRDALSKPWEQVKKELDKCILLCANCHREVHSFNNQS